MTGTAVRVIPTGESVATISITNVSSSEDTMIVLAKYNQAGDFCGVMYRKIEGAYKGANFSLSIPVDNTEGDVAKLKAFCWESFGSMIPMGDSVSFPAE